MNERKITDVDAFISELEAGILKDKLAVMLTEAALATVVNKGSGKVNLSFEIKSLNDAGQVMIKTNLDYTKPTKKGAIKETTTSITPMWVGKGGVITIEQPKEEISGQFTLINGK